MLEHILQTCEIERNTLEMTSPISAIVIFFIFINQSCYKYSFPRCYFLHILLYFLPTGLLIGSLGTENSRSGNDFFKKLRAKDRSRDFYNKEIAEAYSFH